MTINEEKPNKIKNEINLQARPPSSRPKLQPQQPQSQPQQQQQYQTQAARLPETVIKQATIANNVQNQRITSAKTLRNVPLVTDRASNNQFDAKPDIPLNTAQEYLIVSEKKKIKA